MNPSGNQQGSMPLCGSCHQYTCADQQMMCSSCIMKATETLYPLPSGSGPMPQSSAGPQQTNPASGSANPPQTGGHIPGFPNHYGPAPPGTSANANFFPFFSSLEGVSEQDFNNAVFSEAGNLNFLGQNFASAVPPNFGNINNSSSSPNLGSLDNDSSQQPSDSNRFSSPPYEEEDDLNGIWVGDRTSADNVFYYGCFPGSLLGSTNKETQDVCEKLASLLQETHIEDDLASPASELTISTAAKRHLLDLYFRYHYPFFPVLHKPSIMTQFNQGKLPMLLLNVIFAIAYFYTNEESYNFFPQLKDKSNEEVAQEFEAQAKKCLDECFSEAEIYTIQALLLMTLYHHRTTVSNNVWLYSGMATRMAMELGLHKDCENLLNGAFEPIEQEIRKKTWWGCFFLDTMYSTMLGRPLSIQQELCDVKLPTLADDEDDPNEIPCTQVFIAMSKLSQIVGKLNRLLTSVKLKSNLQDRATRAHDCLVSLKNWFKMLPPSLKKVPEAPPENIAIKNCCAESHLTPLLLSFYHTAIIVGQVLVHTDGLFRVTNTNLMSDSLHSATEIVRIMTRFDSFYAVHGLSFKFYPLYVSAFLFLHKIKVSATPTPPPQGQHQSHDSSSAGDQWNSLFLSCLTTLNKFSQHLENGRYSMIVLTGMAAHQKVKLPEAFKRVQAQALVSTQNAAHASSMGNAFFSAAMANPQAMFGMVGNNIDAQALAEMAALGQNSQFNLDLNSTISSLGSNPQYSNPQAFNASGQPASGTYPSFAPEQFTMGLFRTEDLMNLPTGLTENYVDSMMNNQANQDRSQSSAHIEEINASSSSGQNSGGAKPHDVSSASYHSNPAPLSNPRSNTQQPNMQSSQPPNQGAHMGQQVPHHSSHQNPPTNHQTSHSNQGYNQQSYAPQQNYSQPGFPQTYGPSPPDMYNSNMSYQQNYSGQSYGQSAPSSQSQAPVPNQSYNQHPGNNYNQMYNSNYNQHNQPGNQNMNYQQSGQYSYHQSSQPSNPAYQQQQQGYSGHPPQYSGQQHPPSQ